MTKKLEEALNLLPDIEDMLPSEEEDQEPTKEEIEAEIAEYSTELTIAERTDAALPTVTGLEELEREMDEYAAKAMETFEDLVDLGKSVEDRHAAPIFDSASKMISAALQAKQSKMDKKLKIIELQMRQRRLDVDEEKAQAYIQNKNREHGGVDEESVAEGKVIGSRSELLAEIMNKMDKNDK